MCPNKLDVVNDGGETVIKYNKYPKLLNVKFSPKLRTNPSCNLLSLYTHALVELRKHCTLITLR